tara:strand:- start:276 stop:1526 length:1251 start_codon:yes stop_codon:yes gene_type:complete
MSGYFYKFGQNDIFHNQIKAHPQNEFVIWDSKIYYNNSPIQVGAFTSSVPGVPTGYVNLYEINTDRNGAGTANGTGYISPYVIKSSDKISFKTISDEAYAAEFDYGAKVTGHYPMSASITRMFFRNGLSSSTVIAEDGFVPQLELGSTGSALKNSFNYYKIMSPHYAYSASSPYLLNKASSSCSLVCIPSIFYGSSIKKGTVDLKFYVTGSLLGELKDSKRNGELIQTGPAGSTGSGSVAGVVLYNEGFIYLSGAWDLGTENVTFDAASKPKWIHFGAGANDSLSSAAGAGAGKMASASFSMAFSGTSYVPTITMFAHAKKGELNHSNNFTYIKHNQTSSLTPDSGSYMYKEKDLEIKNIISSAYADPTGSFEKVTYISKIGIYDAHKNLIGVASTARPIKKTPELDLTFKLKLDI